MTHEKIVTREDGTQYRIYVEFTYAYSSPIAPLEYTVKAYIKRKNQNTWHDLDGALPYNRERFMHPSEVKDFNLQNALQFVTAEEIYKAKLELWELLKPTV